MWWLPHELNWIAYVVDHMTGCRRNFSSRASRTSLPRLLSSHWTSSLLSYHRTPPASSNSSTMLRAIVSFLPIELPLSFLTIELLQPHRTPHRVLLSLMTGLLITAGKSLGKISCCLVSWACVHYGTPSPTKRNVRKNFGPFNPNRIAARLGQFSHNQVLTVTKICWLLG